MVDFIKNYKTTIVAIVAAMMGVVSQIWPEIQEFMNQVQIFILALIGFLAKDADKSGTTVQPR